MEQQHRKWRRWQTHFDQSTKYFGKLSYCQSTSYESGRERACWVWLPGPEPPTHESGVNIFLFFISCWSHSWPWCWSWSHSNESGAEPFKLILILVIALVMVFCNVWYPHFPLSPPPEYFLQCEITYLSSVGSISWKYLTPKRPHDAKTEPFFSRSAKIDFWGRWFLPISGWLSWMDAAWWTERRKQHSLTWLPSILSF